MGAEYIHVRFLTMMHHFLCHKEKSTTFLAVRKIQNSLRPLWCQVKEAIHSFIFILIPLLWWAYYGPQNFLQKKNFFEVHSQIDSSIWCCYLSRWGRSIVCDIRGTHLSRAAVCQLTAPSALALNIKMFGKDEDIVMIFCWVFGDIWLRGA